MAARNTPNINLTQAFKIRSMSERGVSQKDIAAALGIHRNTVSNILRGKGLVHLRHTADHMEYFLGGAVIGEGNYRALCEAPGDDNNDGHDIRRASHPIGETWENGQKVLPTPDTLDVLLADELILAKVKAEGVNPDELLLIDYSSDTCPPSRTWHQGGTPKRNPAIHNETWDEFQKRMASEGVVHKGASNKRLENEGQDVDVWRVRDPAFKGWPTSTWTHDTTNRERY